MILNKEVLLKLFVIFLISVSFFLGYFLRENAAGGGPEFYELSWPIIQSFKEDFLFSIKNYGSFHDYTIPFSHILNAYINPFSNDIENFQLSITIISFAIFLIFALVFKNIFKHINFVDILLASSVILLLPMFRTSAFWGKNENFGWLFFILALYLYHFKCHQIYKQLQNGVVKHSSNFMRLFNEGATIILFSVVFLVIVRHQLNWIFGVLGIFSLAIILMIMFKIYKRYRKK